MKCNYARKVMAHKALPLSYAAFFLLGSIFYIFSNLLLTLSYLAAKHSIFCFAKISLNL